MKNLSRFNFYTLLIFGCLVLFYLGAMPVNYPGETDDTLTLLHGMVSAVCIITSIVLFVCTLINIWDEDTEDYFYKLYKEKMSNSEGKSGKLWLIPVVISCVLLGMTINAISKHAVLIYNTSITYQNNYKQLVQEKEGFYDKMWKTYSQKDKITNLNKETFLIVTKLIMDSRKDGQSVAWKWVQENQQIPYSEFTKFYADLSDFIGAQREEYFNIEKKCQELANTNNTMLDIFPNNIYNKFLECKHIKFEYGFTSDKTEEVFKTKKENDIF